MKLMNMKSLVQPIVCSHINKQNDKKKVYINQVQKYNTSLKSLRSKALDTCNVDQSLHQQIPCKKIINELFQTVEEKHNYINEYMDNFEEELFDDLRM
jgi:hypothetical protein